MKPNARRLTYALVGQMFLAGTVLSQGISTKLDSALSKAHRLIQNDARAFFKNVESVIVYRHGRTIFEEYYNGHPGDSLHHVQSQTKSVVSLLMGIAIDRGFITDEDVPVSRYYPAHFGAGDRLKTEVRIKDLLTMSSGCAWEEMIPLDDPQNDNTNMYRSNHWLSYALSRPMAARPSTAFVYNSGSPMIVAGIIETATKMSLSDFAEKYLFKPLGISEYFWLKDSTGFCHAGGGLYLSPGDMLKIGILVLNDGQWENRAIVSKDWIRKATRSYFATSFDNGGYGYFWWIREMSTGRGRTTKVVSAEGAGGQNLYIFKEYGLVVSCTERNYTTPRVGPILIKETILGALE